MAREDVVFPAKEGCKIPAPTLMVNDSVRDKDRIVHMRLNGYNFTLAAHHVKAMALALFAKSENCDEPVTEAEISACPFNVGDLVTVEGRRGQYEGGSFRVGKSPYPAGDGYVWVRQGYARYGYVLERQPIDNCTLVKKSTRAR
jgi:hypothetical protein